VGIAAETRMVLCSKEEA
jgi:hypothetical protein